MANSKFQYDGCAVPDALATNQIFSASSIVIAAAAAAAVITGLFAVDMAPATKAEVAGNNGVCRAATLDMAEKAYDKGSAVIEQELTGNAQFSNRPTKTCHILVQKHQATM